LPFFFGDKYTIYKYSGDPRARLNLTDENIFDIAGNDYELLMDSIGSANRYVGKDGLYHYDLCKAKSNMFINNLTTTRQIITTTTTNTMMTTTYGDGDDEPGCTRDNAESWPFYVFIGAQFCLSLGIAPLFSLGISYLCDNLDEKFHALYTGNQSFLLLFCFQ
jgi:hypothetical protein